MTNISAVEYSGDMSGAPAMSKAERRKVVEQLKQRDNTTNFYYLAQVYVVLIGTVGLTIWSYGLVADAGLAWWWNIPATVVAVFIMGATQHQLGGVIHEATHHILFKNRKLNELASDWLAAFPIVTSTYSFRLHHLAHHQFVNDTTRDPNFEMGREGGYWLDFPVEHIDLLVGIVRLLWPPNLVRYIAARARQSSFGGSEAHPYTDTKKAGSHWPPRIGVIHTIATPFLILPLHIEKMYLAAMLVVIAATAAAALFYLLVPKEAFKHSRLDPVISHRTTAVSRTVFTGLLYLFLTSTEYATGHPTWNYYLLLWILPLFTTFPVFMILREWLQHGNADRGRYTNSRIILFNPLTQYAVMPWGMDYHLPHHLMAIVPHYNLRKFHEFLLQTDQKYAANAQVVQGWSHSGDQELPTIVEALGPAYAPNSGEIHIAADVLEYSHVNDQEAIDSEEAASRQEQQHGA